MRLLKYNSNGNISLTKDLADDDIPKYAILSHRWGPPEDEVIYEDMINGNTENKRGGYRKLQFCAKQATCDNLEYFWIDTCCINKSNSTELSESINSMFRWYKNAERCYVYLSDVSIHTQDGQSHVEWESAFRNSRWFTRGWTLQELLAPNIVVFYSQDHVRLGDKRSLERHITDVTGITAEALHGRKLSDFSIEERLLWAEKRQTTKEEDKAYCLLGIFDVFLPLLYGEGQLNAIRRLNKEVRESMSTESLSKGK
jgi:hypothetical protein